MKLVCVGQSAYDITYMIHEPLIENQKYRIQEKMECIGAPATNAASLCARWGLDTTLISRIGSDTYGKLIQEVLNQDGVHTEYMLVQQGNTSISMIITHIETGSRTIFNCPMTKSEQAFTFPQQCDVILMDGHELEASLQLLKCFPNAISILDAGTAREDVVALASHCHHLVCSQDFARQYTGIEINREDETSVIQTFEKLKNLCPHQIVVTLGESGLLYEQNQKIHHMKARQVQAIDTTGAGDIFHGAYAYGISKGWKLEKCLDIATRASGLSVTKVGGNCAIPTLQEIAFQIEMDQELQRK